MRPSSPAQSRPAAAPGSPAARRWLPALVLAACCAAAAGEEPLPRLEVFKRSFLVNGKPLYLKGVNWNPVRRGGRAKDIDFRGFVEADAELMAYAGINAVRTYNPIVDLDVLDALWKRKIYVLMTVYATAEQPISAVLEPVRIARSHPAVITWILGNEWNMNGLYQGWPVDVTRAIIKDAAKLVRSVDSTRPICTVFGGLPDKETVLHLADTIDVWGINQYNEHSFGGLFDRWQQLGVEKPMFVSEYGADAYDSRKHAANEAAQAEATTRFSDEIGRHSTTSGGVCMGGIIFEFADEWWKSGSPDRHDASSDQSNVYGAVAPDRVFNEEWWGLVNYDGTPRRAFAAYAKVKSPGCGRSTRPGCARELPSYQHLYRYRIRSCGAHEACAGQPGLCCPDASGAFDSCCDMSLVNRPVAETPAAWRKDEGADQERHNFLAKNASHPHPEPDDSDGVDWQCDTNGYYFRFQGPKSWPVAEREWCCEHKGLGCEDKAAGAEKAAVAEKFELTRAASFAPLSRWPFAVWAALCAGAALALVSTRGALRRSCRRSSPAGAIRVASATSDPCGGGLAEDAPGHGEPDDGTFSGALQAAPLASGHVGYDQSSGSAGGADDGAPSAAPAADVPAASAALRCPEPPAPAPAPAAEELRDGGRRFAPEQVPMLADYHQEH